jgi:DnaK suppressor protein
MTNTARRRAHLERVLRDRRRGIQGEVRLGIRDGRTDRLKQGGDDIERSDAHSQGDIELALLQMRAETVRRIDAALGRLEAGTYGSCVECAKEIAERRLRALPFAVRCQACEAKHEEGHARAQQLAQRRGSASLFSDVVSS